MKTSELVPDELQVLSQFKTLPAKSSNTVKQMQYFTLQGIPHYITLRYKTNDKTIKSKGVN